MKNRVKRWAITYPVGLWNPASPFKGITANWAKEPVGILLGLTWKNNPGIPLSWFNNFYHRDFKVQQVWVSG